MAKLLIKRGRVIDPASNIDQIKDVYIDNGRIAEPFDQADDVIDALGLWVCPGLIDLHVHFRDPGQTHKEDIETGAKAAALGGFTTVCTMPNTAPPIDSPKLIRYQIDKSRNQGLLDILPIGAITIGQEGQVLAPIADMAKAGAIGISEDGKSVKNAKVLHEAMKIAAEHNLLVLSHCEDMDLAANGVINLGETSKKLGLPGIPNISEDIIIARDIVLAHDAGARLHICHVSTKGGVELIEDAKKRNKLVTAEVCPHHFILNDEDIDGTDTNYKMNPPLRAKPDMAAMIDGLKKGTIDAIATDHAPHHIDEKQEGFLKSPNGITGLSNALALGITYLVERGHLSPLELIDKMSLAPARILGINKGSLAIGMPADVVVIDPDASYVPNSKETYSKGKNTPFGGHTLKGIVTHTIFGGRVIVRDGEIVAEDAKDAKVAKDAKDGKLL